MSTEGLVWIEAPALRRTAFSLELMSPGGIERDDPGKLGREDIDRAVRWLDELLSRPGERDRGRRARLLEVRDRAERLDALLGAGSGRALVYVSREVFALEPVLRSAALEIDFSFGDQDGRVSVADLRQARLRYRQVRGPVGWNRLLLCDQVERQLYPERTLKTTSGTLLLPSDWLADGHEPLAPLRKVARYLDDAALARTFADVAARLACSEPESHARDLFHRALALLGREIRSRESIRPTLTDIARIGCEDPAIRAQLGTPIEMSRKLSPAELLDRYLD